jgi:hypothetical protein
MEVAYGTMLLGHFEDDLKHGPSKLPAFSIPRLVVDGAWNALLGDGFKTSARASSLCCGMSIGIPRAPWGL